MNLKRKLEHLSYEVRRRVFEWRADRDGDLSLVIGGVVGLTKYKESTIVTFPWKKETWPTKPAKKWQGHDSE